MAVVIGWQPTLDRHLEMARRISECDHPNLVVYGGGNDIQAIINGFRRMGFTKEKIAAAGYNPDIVSKGYFGTGGRKQ